jgi:hypothetical protein
MMSHRKPLTKFALSDLGIDVAIGGNSFYEVVELSIPQKDGSCRMANGETIEEKVEDFARQIVAVTGSM